jgi:hypothetical protein
MNTQLVRFSANLPISSTRLLVKNSGRVLGDFFYGKIYDISKVRDNAFILSSLIQVLSRIFVANRSAMQTKGTQEGPYRYKEAVKTTFREAMGFVLSYVVLRAFQRGTMDFFKNYLWVKEGVSSAPTLFNGIFRKAFNVPSRIGKQAPRYFPTFMETLGRLGQQVRNFFTGKLEKIDLKSLENVIPDVIEKKGVIIHPRRMAQYKRLEPFVDKINRLEAFLTGKPVNTTIPQRLETFFNWVPPLVGSIPALLLSGFALERFSQTKAEPMAKKIAAFFGKNNPQPSPFISLPAGVSLQRPRNLDHFNVVPYASGQQIPQYNPGLMFYGYPFTPPRF